MLKLARCRRWAVADFGELMGEYLQNLEATIIKLHRKMLSRRSSAAGEKGAEDFPLPRIMGRTRMARSLVKYTAFVTNNN